MLFPLLSFALLCLLLSGILFRHQRLLTYVAAAAGIWQGLWLLSGFIHRILLPSVPSAQFYRSAAFVSLALFVLLVRQFRWPAIFTSNSFVKDLVILPVIAVTVFSAYVVASANYQQGSFWVTHGFFNGDTLTFASLVQRSRLQEGLVAENPLAGNGSLEYPTLLHGTVADMLELANTPWNWFGYLPWLTYIQIIIIVPLFFLLADIALPSPLKDWQMWLGVPSRMIVLLLQAGIVLLTIMFSFDNYIYPQSHFFLFGIFLAALCALAVSPVSSTNSF